MSDSTPEIKSESRLAFLQQRMKDLQPVGAATQEEEKLPPQAPSRTEKETAKGSTRHLDLPPGPIVKRKKTKKLTFAQMHTTISLSIDNRIAKDFKNFLEKGETKTAIANKIALKILIEAGYPIDEDILQKPFPGSE